MESPFTIEQRLSMYKNVLENLNKSRYNNDFVCCILDTLGSAILGMGYSSESIEDDFPEFNEQRPLNALDSCPWWRFKEDRIKAVEKTIQLTELKIKQTK